MRAAAQIPLKVFLLFFSICHTTVLAGIPYEFEVNGERLTGEVHITEVCRGLLSSTQCCGRVLNPEFNRKNENGVKRVPVQTRRSAQRLVFLCMFMRTVYKDGPKGRTLSYMPQYDGPYLLRCAPEYIAKLKDVKVVGLTDSVTREPLVVTLGHCLPRVAKRQLTVLGGTIQCLDAPLIFPDDTENVIYAWFTNDAGEMQITQWAEVREFESHSNRTNVAFTLHKRYGSTMIGYGPIVSEYQLSMEYEVCILTKDGIDTSINIRLGEYDEEETLWL